VAGPPRGPRDRSALPIQVGMLMVLIALLAAAFLAGHLRHQRPMASQAHPPTTEGTAQLQGTIVAPNDLVATCASGPDGLRQGANVNVLDPGRNPVAAATLGAGQPSHAGGCQWTFTVALPPSSSYLVEIAQLRSVTYTHQDLASQGFHFTLTDAH
jgi:hypothetical protein